MNRGIYWTDIEETEDSWSIRLQTKGYFLPGKVFIDLTPRRLTRFYISPNEVILVNDIPIKADQNGLLTIPKIQLEQGKTVSLELRRNQ